MKCLFFDISAGFSPLMALGSLVDMCKEKTIVNEILKPFGASLFTENVTRGYEYGCLAHIDISPKQISPEEIVKNSLSCEKIKSMAEKYIQLSCQEGYEASLREILEVVCAWQLCESLEAGKILYSGITDFGHEVCDGAQNPFFQPPEAQAQNESVSLQGKLFLKLINAFAGDVSGMNIIETGYGADVETKNPGVLRALLCSDDTELFTIGAEFEMMLAEDFAVM